jgi:hypothetical protein
LATQYSSKVAGICGQGMARSTTVWQRHFHCQGIYLIWLKWTDADYNTYIHGNVAKKLPVCRGSLFLRYTSEFQGHDRNINLSLIIQKTLQSFPVLWVII